MYVGLWWKSWNLTKCLGEVEKKISDGGQSFFFFFPLSNGGQVSH